MAAAGVLAAPRARGAHAVALGVPRPVLWLIGGAWAIALGAQLTGNAGLLHHNSLIQAGAPLWLGALAFAPAWLVMVAAMMLPSSLPALRVAAGSPASPARGTARFLAAYAIGWTAFGLAAFLGDVVVHHAVDTTPWLASRTWLIQLAALLVAGAWQFAPLKWRGLAACRHPVARDGAWRAAVRHVADCLASSWALMFLMFAAGFANLAWMAILAAVMAYEVIGRRGPEVAMLFGFALIGLAAWVAFAGLTGGLVTVLA
jgi:predicted metal-binding membrane protein